MITNKIYDAIYDAIADTTDIAVYRNKASSHAKMPYVVYKLDSTDNSPSTDYALNVYIFDDLNNTSETIQNIADTIDGDGKYFSPSGVNKKIINNNTFTASIDRTIRQYINDEALAGMQMVNIQYSMRMYERS